MFCLVPTKKKSRMEIFFNFKKSFVSSKVIKFLEENDSNEDDKKSLAKLAKGKKLPYKEANSLLISILKAIVIEDGEEDVAYNESPPNNQENNDNLLDESNTEPSPGPSETQKPTQNENRPNSIKKKNGKEKPNICHFYKNGKCKHGKEGQDCRFEHPEICKKFQNNGLKRYNKKGCETNCTEFHPNACRDSLTHKACPRNDCRFYHLKGTKKVDWREVELEKGNVSGKFQNEKRPVFHGTETRNRFDAIRTTPQQSELVFRQDQITATLANIMKELADIKTWQEKHMEKEGERSSSQNWRTQDQRRAWDSQRRESQYSPRH